MRASPWAKKDTMFTFTQMVSHFSFHHNRACTPRILSVISSMEEINSLKKWKIIKSSAQPFVGNEQSGFKYLANWYKVCESSGISEDQTHDRGIGDTTLTKRTKLSCNLRTYHSRFDHKTHLQIIVIIVFTVSEIRFRIKFGDSISRSTHL